MDLRTTKIRSSMRAIVFMKTVQPFLIWPQVSDQRLIMWLQQGTETLLWIESTWTAVLKTTTIARTVSHLSEGSCTRAILRINNYRNWRGVDTSAVDVELLRYFSPLIFNILTHSRQSYWNRLFILFGQLLRTWLTRILPDFLSTVLHYRRQTTIALWWNNLKDPAAHRYFPFSYLFPHIIILI